jgi:hypothetical protein
MLGFGLRTRGGRIGHSSDLQDAVKIHCEAACLSEKTSFLRLRTMSELGKSILISHSSRCDQEHIIELVELQVQAREQCPSQDPFMWTILWRLAALLVLRGSMSSRVSDFQVALSLQRQALSLCHTMSPVTASR